MPSKTKVKSPGTYHLHRERQRRRILAAAEKLFDKQGIDRTTMAEIISSSGLQASTLYEYFSKKDEIVWAIVSQIFEEAAARTAKIVDCAPTGLSKITALLNHMANELLTNQSKVRFMAQFDAMYARDWPVERLLTLENQLNDPGFKVFGTLILEGIADGSLRHDLDPELTLHAVLNGVIGAQRRLASLGSKVEAEYGQPIHRMFQELIRIITLGLAAPEKPAKPSSMAKARESTTRKRVK